MSGGFDPLVPREIDRSAPVPLDADLRTGEAAEALDLAKIFAAPDDADLPAWRERLREWREGARERHPVGDRYDDPASAWASECRVVAQVWLWDELFFDFDAQAFTPERFIADAEARFGGVDGVVLWHAYPVIGIDDRNQWDFYDVPGLPEAAAALRAAGIRVFVDYNPWDTGTRRAGADADELAAVIERLGADGVFLDTLREADPAFVAAMDAARPGIGLEGESRLDTARIADHTLSWAQWFADSPTPGVLRARWFERRHQQHHVRRWHRDHAEELRSAWLNGAGVMVWEVVFGAWVGWSPRDAATLRRMSPVQRGLHRWFVDGEWTPLSVRSGAVSGSSFELDGVTLTVLANTGDVDERVELVGPGHWIALHEPGSRFTEGSTTATVPAAGIAAVACITPEATADLEGDGIASVLVSIAAELAGRPVDPDAAFPHRRARRVTPATPLVPAADGGIPLPIETVSVPPGEHVITVRFRQRETGMVEGAPYVDEWKPLPPRLHDQRTLERVVDVPAEVRIAAREVSELEFAFFLAATGRERAGADEPSAAAPATSVTLADARAYAAWRGGRLPTDDEWQLAAGRPGFERRTPAVWNWTESERSDGRTRFVMLKGGADHRSEGSDWYFDGGVREPEFSAKLLLPGLGIDASSSIGFRICWDGDA